jgi:hypothetical protein
MRLKIIHCLIQIKFIGKLYAAVYVYIYIYIYTYERYRIGEESEKKCYISDHMTKKACDVPPSSPKYSGSSM